MYVHKKMATRGAGSLAGSLRNRRAPRDYKVLVLRGVGATKPAPVSGVPVQRLPGKLGKCANIPNTIATNTPLTATVSVTAATNACPAVSPAVGYSFRPRQAPTTPTIESKTQLNFSPEELALEDLGNA